MSTSSFYPDFTPVLDLDFINTRAIDPKITFTRSSVATRYNELGVLETVGSNVPRLEYDPVTLKPKGFLIERERTNRIRNNTMVGTATGTPGTLPANWSISTAGGVSREVVGFGTTTNGINYIDIRISTPPTGTTNTQLALNLYFDNATQVTASTGQAWTTSMWVQMVGGSTAGIGYAYVIMVEQSAAGADLAYLSGSTFLPTIGTFTRRSYTATTANASTAFIRPGLWIGHTGIGAVIDITLRIGLPQLELGSGATSPIPTSSAPVTRTENCYISSTYFSTIAGSSQGTLLVEYEQLPTDSGAFIASLYLNSTNYIGLSYTASDSSFNGNTYYVNGGSSYNSPLPSASYAGYNKILRTAVSYSSSDVVTFVSGNKLTHSGTFTGVPQINSLYIGSRSNFNINAYIRKILYYNRSMTDSQLEAITK